MRLLKALVVALGITILALTTVIVVTLAMRANDDAPERAAAPAVSPSDATSEARAVIPAPAPTPSEPPQINVAIPLPERPRPFPERLIELPFDGQVVDLAIAGDRLTLHVDVVQGDDRLIVIDLTDGTVLGEIRLRQPGPSADLGEGAAAQ